MRTDESIFRTANMSSLQFPYSCVVHRPDPSVEYYEARKSLGGEYARLTEGDLAEIVLQAALDFLKPSVGAAEHEPQIPSGGLLQIKRGVYPISTTLSIPQGVNFIGEGSKQVTFIPKGITKAISVFDDRKPSLTRRVMKARIGGFTINDLNGILDVGLELKYAIGNELIDVDIFGTQPYDYCTPKYRPGSKGLVVDGVDAANARGGGWWNEFRRVRVYDFEYGVYLTGGTNGKANANLFENFYARLCKYGGYIDRGNENLFLNCGFAVNTVGFGWSDTADANDRTIFVGGTFEGNMTQDLEGGPNVKYSVFLGVMGLSLGDIEAGNLGKYTKVIGQSEFCHYGGSVRLKYNNGGGALHFSYPAENDFSIDRNQTVWRFKNPKGDRTLLTYEVKNHRWVFHKPVRTEERILSVSDVFADLKAIDVRAIPSPDKGYIAYHDGSGGGTEGPCFYNGTSWISLVDGLEIS